MVRSWFQGITVNINNSNRILQSILLFPEVRCSTWHSLRINDGFYTLKAVTHVAIVELFEAVQREMKA